jgi:hypothetical protein
MNATSKSLEKLFDKNVEDVNEIKRKTFLSSNKRSLAKMGSIYINEK